MSTVRRLPVVAVIGSSRPVPVEVEERTFAAGRFVAEQGWHLLTGGGPGVMGAAAQGFCSVAERRGMSFGVLPEQLPPGVDPSRYPNPWVEVSIQTHLGVEPEGLGSRNPINVLSGHVVLAFPGAVGTRGEVQLARRYGRPLVAWLRGDESIGGLGAAALRELEVPVESESERVFAFLRDTIARLGSTV
ncbi:MAG: molybdenum cofactor carrier protein [Acidobacteriota bacterium]